MLGVDLAVADLLGQRRANEADLAAPAGVLGKRGRGHRWAAPGSR